MKIPAGTQSGTDFKLSTVMAYRIFAPRVGAHIVGVVVDTPTKISTRELLEQFEGAAKRILAKSSRVSQTV